MFLAKLNSYRGRGRRSPGLRTLQVLSAFTSAGEIRDHSGPIPSCCLRPSRARLNNNGCLELARSTGGCRSANDACGDWAGMGMRGAEYRDCHQQSADQQLFFEVHRESPFCCSVRIMLRLCHHPQPVAVTPNCLPRKISPYIDVGWRCGNDDHYNGSHHLYRP